MGARCLLDLECAVTKSVPFSLLELASVREGDTVGETLANSVAYARHAESLGFQRFWLAEHHNMQGISSAATSVLIGHIAGATESIRVGSGGVMLPNHPPLVIAEQFGTLESLYPIGLTWAWAVRREPTQ